MEVGSGATKRSKCVSVCFCLCVTWVYLSAFVFLCACVSVCVCAGVCVCVPDIHKPFHTRPAAQQQRGQECGIDRPSCRAQREVTAASAEIEHVLVGAGDFRGETTGHSAVTTIQQGLTWCAGLGHRVY